MAEEQLLDYEEEETNQTNKLIGAAGDTADGQKAKGAYASMHSSGFRDLMLRPELLRAIIDCGFEHPSEVQHECIPQAILGMDIICQAKSGMGKTAVFVLSTLQQIQPEDGNISVLVMCHTRELAFQISKEYERFTKYMPDVKVGVFFGGMPVRKDEGTLRDSPPHIVVGTPGRLLALLQSGALKLKKVKYFILDECDRMIGEADMRSDVFQIFKFTPQDKQVMMFSATLPKDLRPLCKKFMKEPLEVFVDDEAKLTLHGLQQFYVRVKENEKNKKLLDLLDALEFNQVVIFVRSVSRCQALNQLLTEQSFPSIDIHRQMSQDERLSRYQQFKDFQKRILVATNLFGRGMDIERVNIVFNYDMPEETDAYLHRVARAGRFGTKGLAITFVSDKSDAELLNKVQDRFDVTIADLPTELDVGSYSEIGDPPVLNAKKPMKSTVVAEKKKNVSVKQDIGPSSQEIVKSKPILTKVTFGKTNQGRSTSDKDGQTSRQLGNRGREQRIGEVEIKGNSKFDQEPTSVAEEDKKNVEGGAEKNEEDAKSDSRSKLTLEEWKAQSKVDEPKFNVRKAGDGCSNKDILEKLVPIQREDFHEVDEGEHFYKEVILGKRKQREKHLSLDFKFADNKHSSSNVGSGQRRGDPSSRGRGTRRDLTSDGNGGRSFSNNGGAEGVPFGTARGGGHSSSRVENPVGRGGYPTRGDYSNGRGGHLTHGGGQAESSHVGDVQREVQHGMQQNAAFMSSGNAATASW